MSVLVPISGGDDRKRHAASGAAGIRLSREHTRDRGVIVEDLNLVVELVVDGLVLIIVIVAFRPGPCLGGGGSGLGLASFGRLAFGRLLPNDGETHIVGFAAEL